MTDAAAPRASGWLVFYALLALAFCLALDALAGNASLVRAMMARSSAVTQARHVTFTNTGPFVDYEERVLLDEIPGTDFRRGGVFLFGSSNTKWALTTWDLPPEQRRRLRDYGTGGASHSTIRRLVRYLGESGRLTASPHNLVIIGVSFHLGIAEGPDSYFPALVRRQGVYAIGPDDRLRDADIGPVDRWWRVHKARAGGFLRNIGRWANGEATVRLRSPGPVVHDAAAYGAGWRSFMGPDWQRTTVAGLAELRKTLNYLHALGVPVKVMLLPQGSWMDALPFGRFYEPRVRAVARETGTPVINWSRAFSDDEFVDSNHLTVAGQTKFREKLFREEGAAFRALDREAAGAR